MALVTIPSNYLMAITGNKRPLSSLVFLAAVIVVLISYTLWGIKRGRIIIFGGRACSEYIKEDSAFRFWMAVGFYVMLTAVIAWFFILDILASVGGNS